MKKIKQFIEASQHLLEENFFLNIPLLTASSLIAIAIFIPLAQFLSGIIVLRENINIKNDLARELIPFWRPEPYEKFVYFIGIIFIPIGSLLLLCGIKFLLIYILKEFHFSLFFHEKLKITQTRSYLYEKRKDKKSLAIEILLIFFIIILTFNQNFSRYILHPDSTFVLAPVYDILHNKMILVETYSQYGLLNIYFLASLFTFAPLTYQSLYLITSVIYAIQYLLVYVFFRRLLKPVIAFLALLLIFYYTAGMPFFYDGVFNGRVPAYTYPQGSLIRTLPFFVIFLLLSFKKNYLPYFFTGIFMFWNVEVGLSVLLVILITTTLKLLTERLLKRHILTYIYQILTILGSFSITLSIISFITKYISGSYPDWSFYTKYARIYSAGFSMIPIPKFYLPYYGVLAMYLFSLFYIFFIILLRKKEEMLSTISFITFYGIVYFNYYLGRSHPYNLPSVSLPALILFVFYAKKSYAYYLKQTGIRRKILLIYFFIPILFIFDTFVRFIALIPDTLISFHRGIPLFRKTIDFNRWDFDNQNLNNIAGAIEKLVPLREKQIALLTGWYPYYNELDTFLLLKTKKTNLMPTPYFTSLFLESDRKKAVNKIKEAKPKYIFVENHSFPQKYFKQLMLENSYYLATSSPLLIYYRNDIRPLRQD